MPLVVDDFISPAGELTESMFPGDDLEEFVAAWLADAVARSDDEARQRSWVLHRAYKTVANRFHAGLASESEGPVSASVSAEQFRYWNALADKHARAAAGSGMYRPVW